MKYRIGRTVEKVNERSLFGEEQYDSRQILEKLGLRIIQDQLPTPSQAYTYLVEIPERWVVTNQGLYHTTFESPDKKTVIWSFIKNDPWDVQGWVQITSDKI